jgi:hypothetical protein
MTRRCLVLTSFALAIGLCVISRSEEELWKNCSTPKTDYVLQIPGSLVRSADPAVTGCTYQTSDGEFTVEAVETETARDENLDSRMQKEISLLGDTVTDQKKGKNWFAVSGIAKDGTEYYRIHYTSGARWVTLRITYPRDQRKKYDKWVTRIDKEFVPFAKTPEKPKTDPTPDKQG